MLPDGVGFDPGGIGKGFAADLVSDALAATGARGVCVNIGGDARVRGVAPDERAGGVWTIDVLDPGDDTVRATVALQAGAVATSSRVRRSWVVGGQVRHHLVDPHAGAPVENEIVSVTVVASDGWRAEVLAKAAFVGGVEHGLALLDDLGAAGVAFDRSGGTHPSASWPRFVVSRAATGVR
jgi:thiamine biosynthesis lipoprotein